MLGGTKQAPMPMVSREVNVSDLGGALYPLGHRSPAHGLLGDRQIGKARRKGERSALWPISTHLKEHLLVRDLERKDGDAVPFP